MTQLHTLAGLALLVATAVALVIALAELARRQPLRILVDRVLLVWIAIALAVDLSGLVLLVTTGPPADVLHLVYGVAAPVVLLGARYLVQGRWRDRRALALTVGALLALGVVVRSLLTGG